VVLGEIVSSKFARRVRVFMREVGVSEELRGWNWDSGILSPPLKGVLLSVSDVAARYCPTRRDVYLKYVEGVVVKPTLPMVEGRVYHNVISGVVLEVKRKLYSLGLVSGYELYESLVESCEARVRDIVLHNVRVLEEEPRSEDVERMVVRGVRLWKFLALQFAASVDRYVSVHGHLDVDSVVAEAVPHIVEYKVDGSPLGLSKELSVDVLYPGYTVVEVKTGSRQDFHRLYLAGYALAFEADKEIPVNMGVLIYVRAGRSPTPFFKIEEYVVSDELRREFIEARDEVFEIIENERDPGKPLRCYPYCPYYKYC